MRYGQCKINSAEPFSLSGCEFRTGRPIEVPDTPSYGLLRQKGEKPRLVCTRPIGVDELVSETPVQIVGASQIPVLRRLGLMDLCFEWGRQPAREAVAFGAGAFVGHSENPNCYWKPVRERRSVRILPRREISPGEELTVDYDSHLRRRCRKTDAPSEIDPEKLRNIPEPEQPKAVVVSDSEYGRTLIAVQDLAPGEKIAEVPARIIPVRNGNLFARLPTLVDVAHGFGQYRSAIALGIPAFVNHSCPANSFYMWSKEHGTISLVTYRDWIEAGTEITMNYNGHPLDRSPIDFEVIERPEPLKVPLV